MRQFHVTYHLAGGEKITGGIISAQTKEEALKQACLPLTDSPGDGSPSDSSDSSPLLSITSDNGGGATAVLKSAIVAVTVGTSTGSRRVEA